MSNNPNYQIITEQNVLEAHVKQWLKCSVIFLDTEFIRTSTFYPKLALIQITANEATYLIDPLAIEDISSLKALLSNDTVLKVLHALSEDIEVFLSKLDLIIAPVFDTQIASKWLNIGENIGYAKLVEQLLQVTLPKDQTQSDWLQRPLTDSQKQYAADDVIYLEKLFQILQQQLNEKSLMPAVLEDSQRLADNMKVKPFEQYYLKVKRAWKLPEKNQYILKQLCTWRETMARTDDVPRSRVFNDVALSNIAQRLASSKSQIASITDAHPKQIRKYAQFASEIVINSLEFLEKNKLENFVAIQKPLSVKAQGQFKKLKQKVNQVAENLDIYPDCLCNKKQLESFFRKYVLQQTNVEYDEGYFSGFRQQYLQNVLLEFINRD